MHCRQFLNPYFHSSYDNGSYVDVEPIAATAVVLARALHALAAPVGAPALKVGVVDRIYYVGAVIQIKLGA
jgi:hypothetical protein